MDGASKFVRGDAIAGLIILAVNIFGGIVIGATPSRRTKKRASQNPSRPASWVKITRVIG
jgi:flagellar biosynthesis protein FlhA